MQISSSEILLFIFIIVAFLILAQSLLAYAEQIPVIGGAETEPSPALSRAEEILGKFLTEQINAELVRPAEELSQDIIFDTGDLSAARTQSLAKSKTRDTALSKIILDSIVLYYAHNARPATESGEQLERNVSAIKKLSPGSSFSQTQTERLCKYIEDLLREVKQRKEKPASENLGQAELYRRWKFLSVAGAAPSIPLGGLCEKAAEELREELTRARVTLREAQAELSRLRARPASSLTAELLLEDCNRERRALHERVFELRRDIERLRELGRMPAHSHSEIESLRARIEALNSRNSALEAQLSAAARSHTSESGQIAQLRSELSSCQSLLNDVLNAQSG